jgi:hypothetical protein
MSKKDKLWAKFMEVPPKKNLTWNELSALMLALGFEILQGDGSRVKFYHKAKDTIINLHKPHPDNLLKTYLVKQIQDKLKEAFDG